MRLNRYIKEEDIPNKVIDDTIALLRKDCGPFLKDLSKAEAGRFVLRGIKRSLKGGQYSLIEKFKPRKDRWPQDVPQEIHEYVDKELKYKFGWKPRSEGVFTTSRYMVAASFGIPMLFFPIGKYKYIWAPGVKDFLSSLEKEGVAYYSGGKWTVDKSWDKETREDRIDDILDKYSNKFLWAAINGQTEIIFNCKAYYLVDSRWDQIMYQKLEKEIWK
jgi:hypothetical protein